MRIKQLLTKTLLAAAGLCVGASAWAQTTLYEKGTTGHDWAESDLSDWTNSNTTNVTFSIDNGLKFALNAGGRIEYTATKALTTSDDYKVSVSAVWNTGTATGSNSAGNYFTIGGVQVFFSGQPGDLRIIANGQTTNVITGQTALRGKTLNVELTISKKSKTFTYSISCDDYNSGTPITGSGTTATNEISNIVFGWARGGQQVQSSQTIKSLVITEEEDASTVAEYTVKFVDGENNQVKADDTRSGNVGDAIILTSSDKESVYTETIKYKYNSDDASEKTIASDGSTVVTVLFDALGKYSYTLNAVDSEGEILKELGTGEQFVSDTKRVYYPRGFYLGGKLYTTDPNGSYPTYGIDFTEGATKAITYTENTALAYFFEVESLSKSKNWAATGSQPDRYSNGLVGRLLQQSYAYTEPLEGGVYTLKMWARNNASSSTANMDIYVRDAEGNDGSVINFDEDWAKSGQGEKTIENITIPTGSYLVFDNPNTYNSNLEMDYVILVKTAEAPAVTKSVTMGANGYATFASKNALDLANLPTGLKAYTATLSGKELSFNAKADAAVAAGTGLLLKGNPNETYEIPVAATGAAVAGNALTGVTTATALQSNAKGNYIFVMKKAASASDELTFLPLTTESAVTVPAGKAYVSVPATAFAGSARALSVLFDDETTGINNVVTTMQQDGIYSLSGQRVMLPSKGLYIVNGKKVIIK